MSEKVLTEEGLLAAATTSNDDLLDIDEIEVSATVARKGHYNFFFCLRYRAIN